MKAGSWLLTVSSSHNARVVGTEIRVGSSCVFGNDGMNHWAKLAWTPGGEASENWSCAWGEACLGRLTVASG
jgi:hypothetical protein